MIARLACGLAALMIASAIATGEPDRRMVVTIDDLPLNSILYTTAAAQRQVIWDLLHPLAANRVPAIGFVNEGKLYAHGALQDARVDLLRLWLESGQELGNHGYGHLDLHRVPLEMFLADIDKGDTVTRQLLAERDAAPRYFRHPYLHTGRSLDTREAVHAHLRARGYRVAPVTIDNSEWIFARAYEQALKDNDMALADRVGGDYVRYMLAMTTYYEQQTRELFDRDIPQVLLIHANKLNADFLGALLYELSERGYAFVSLDEALKDPVFSSKDEFTGSGGITWLHRWALTAGVDGRTLDGEPRTPNYVLKLAGLPEHTYTEGN